MELCFHYTVQHYDSVNNYAAEMFKLLELFEKKCPHLTSSKNQTSLK